MKDIPHLGSICLLVYLILLPIQAVAYNDIFGNRIDYTVGETPRDIVTADFDQDGDSDLAVANFGSVIGVNDSITILFNDGNGIFQIDTSFMVGDGPKAICAGRFASIPDEEGMKSSNCETIEMWPDLAVLNTLSNTVSVLLNQFGNDFDPQPVFWAGNYPTTLCAARISQSFTDDLIIGNSFSMDLWIMNNNGAGVFTRNATIAVSNDVRSIRTADLDGDGERDLIVTTTGLEILINAGSGSFGTPVVYDTGPGYFGDACPADLDGDGDLDVAGVNASNQIITWLNNGDGTMGQAIVSPASTWPSSVEAADLDRDGDVDLAIRDYDEKVVLVSINDGLGNFSTEGKYSSGTSGPSAITIADFDGDNDIDVVSVNSQTDNISIYFNQTHTARCLMAPEVATATEAYESDTMQGIIYVGDFDIGYPPGDIDPLSVMINDSLRPSSFGVVDEQPDIPGDEVRMDFDLDEFIRMYGAIWGWQPHYFRISGQFSDGTPFGAGGEIYLEGFVPGDVGMDGRVDIGDAVYLMNCLYREGPYHQLDALADANCDGGVDLGDVVYLIAYIFHDGPQPGECE